MNYLLCTLHSLGSLVMTRRAGKDCFEKNGVQVLTFAFSAYSLIQRSSWGMVQLFKVIVLMSVVLVLALVGIVHQVSWSPGQLFLHSHLQIGKKKQVFVNILIFYCWFSGPPLIRWFYSILHSLVWKIGSARDFSRKNFQRYSHAAYLTIQIDRPCLHLKFGFQFGCKFTNCLGTSKRSFLPRVEAFDAVLFSGLDLHGRFEVSMKFWNLFCHNSLS